MFFELAFAQSASGTTDAPSFILQFMPFVLILVIFYFLLIRPQQKKAAKHQEMLKAIRRGDMVTTAGGLIAKVTKVLNDDELEIEIAENVRAKVVRGMIAEVRVKGEPVKD